MTIGQSEDFRVAASMGRRTFLDNGPANATIEVYATARPVDGAAAGGTPLVTIALAKPCGEIAAGALVLAQEAAGGDLILASGDAVWARFVAGDGEWAFDAEVSADGGGGEVQFPDTHLFAGGRAVLALSAIG